MRKKAITTYSSTPLQNILTRKIIPVVKNLVNNRPTFIIYRPTAVIIRTTVILITLRNK